jgi:hypothetical protein
MKWLQFILSHSFFIALCAVGLCFQTALLLHIQLSVCLYGFIFFSTLCGYNFYWLLSAGAFTQKKLVTVLKQHYTNVVVLITAAGAMLLFASKIQTLLPAISIGLLLTLLYAVPLLPFKQLHVTRKIGLLKTVLLAFTWAYVTVYIPYQQLQSGNLRDLILLFNNRFLFMLMLCIIFDARDTDMDKIRGLQSLTTLLRPASIGLLMVVIFSLYIINGIIFNIYFNEPMQLIALLITGAVTAVVFFFSLKKQGYLFYYFLVDGLMLFSSIAAYLASI